MKMEFQKVLPSDPSIVMFAKIAVNQGRSPGLEKDAFYDAIMKRANDLRADGESQQQAFAKTITDDPTGQLLYQAMKIAPGSEVKPVPQPAPPSREETAELAGPAHARMHSMAVDFQRAHPRHSYESAYSRVYSAPENSGLRDKVRNEHLGASMASVSGQGLGKAAPADALQDDVSPGAANQELHELVVTRMKNNPKLSCEQSFVHEYLSPQNRGLKNRVDAEGVMHMRHLAPVRSFPPYGHPGDEQFSSTHRPVGRSGAKPRGYAGG
jgi:hypothetical protein